jgi:hypothetical protein
MLQKPATQHLIVGKLPRDIKPDKIGINSSSIPIQETERTKEILRTGSSEVIGL